MPPRDEAAVSCSMSEDPKLGVSQAPRSCDRCFNLKTQCDLAEVCGRCKRLGVECTKSRPVRRKGRPRKTQAIASVESRTQAEPPLMNLIQKLLDQVNTPQLNATFAFSLVEQILTLGPSHGLYAALLADHHLTSPIHADISSPPSFALTCNAPSEEAAGFNRALTPSLLGTLLSVALELRQKNLFVIDPVSAKIGSHALSSNVLANLPQVTSPIRPTVSDALSLLFLGHTFCFTSEYSDSSTRWIMLARVILAVSKKDDESLADQDLQQRALFGLKLQENLLSLLHYNNALLFSQQSFRSDLSSTNKSPRTDNAYKPINMHPESYMKLFSPLLKITHLLSQQPQSGTRAWIEVFESLEEYYIIFPPSLVKFDDLEFLYQAEAMIWMHGLFIILYVGRDLLNIMLRPDVLDEKTIQHVLGHSLLLGEVLPTVERLGGEFEYLSPAVVYFLLVSSTIQIATLGIYLNKPRGETRADEDKFGMARATCIPRSLVTASWSHLQTLSAIRTRCARYDSPLLADIQKLLASCYNCAVLGSRQPQNIPATTLMLYRWAGNGTGAIPLPSEVARAEWSFPEPPERDIHKSLCGHTELFKEMVDEVCSPECRICEPGYFDLSIII